MAFITHHHHYVRYNIAVIADQIGQMPDGERHMLTNGCLSFFFCIIRRTLSYYSMFNLCLFWILKTIQNNKNTFKIRVKKIGQTQIRDITSWYLQHVIVRSEWNISNKIKLKYLMIYRYNSK